MSTMFVHVHHRLRGLTYMCIMSRTQLPLPKCQLVVDTKDPTNSLDMSLTPSHFHVNLIDDKIIKKNKSLRNRGLHGWVCACMHVCVCAYMHVCIKAVYMCVCVCV